MRGRSAGSIVLCFLTGIAFRCQNFVSTDDLLNGNGVWRDLSVEPESFSIQAATKRELTIRGGRKPYTAKILGSGTQVISGATLQYTAGDLIGRDIITIADSSGKSTSVSANVTDEGKEPRLVSGNTLWLKADALNLANGMTLSSWPDSSGNARDYATGSPKPVMAANQLNGLPVVSFDGTQYLERSYDAGLNSAPFTIIILYSASAYPTGGADNFASLFMSRNTNTGFSFFIRNAMSVTAKTNEIYYGSGGGYNVVNGGNSISLNTWYLAEAMMENSTKTVTISQNGIVFAQDSRIAASYVTNSVMPSRIGAGTTEAAATQFFSGKIAELMHFNRVLSAAELQSIRCYLKRKYDLSFGCGSN